MSEGRLVRFLAATTAYCLLGGSRIVYREFAVERCNVAFFVLIRALFTPIVLFFAGIIAYRHGRLLYPTSRKEALVIFSNGSLLVATITLGVLAMDFLSASVFAVVQLADPVATMLISVLAKAEPMPDVKSVTGWARIVGFLVTMAATIGLA